MSLNFSVCTSSLLSLSTPRIEHILGIVVNNKAYRCSETFPRALDDGDDADAELLIERVNFPESAFSPLGSKLANIWIQREVTIPSSPW